MGKYFLYACLYHRFGFNVTHIVPSQNEIIKPQKNKYKASSNDYSKYHFLRQTFEELKSFDWESATGVGAIMGYGKLRALDFDGCNDVSFLREVLSYLSLPSDYEWVSRTGSKNGFHIYILAEEHGYSVKGDRIKAFKHTTRHFNKEA